MHDANNLRKSKGISSIQLPATFLQVSSLVREEPVAKKWPTTLPGDDKRMEKKFSRKKVQQRINYKI